MGGAGQTYAAESRAFRDERTGAAVRQVTAHPSIHHHPFYYLPAYDDAMERLVFVSHRTGRPEVFAEQRRQGGRLLQLTDHPGVAEWSVHPSHDGRHVYFADAAGGCRVDCRTLAVERLFAFADVVGGGGSAGGGGMVGAAMGTTAVSRDDRFWAVPVRAAVGFRLVIVGTAARSAEVVLEAPEIGHPEFHPEDNRLLRYAGSFRQRMWVVNRDGTGNRLAFARDAAAKQWIVHETWSRRPGTRELLTADWPHGVLAVDADAGAARAVAARFNAWHPMVNRAGSLMVSDTVFPDVGLQLFDPRPGAGPRRVTLCFPQASSRGDHWGVGHCPYDDGPVAVYAPQHTHPHPNFSPDGRRVVFTSDRTGHAQVYEVELGADVFAVE